nr:hypothetical protein [Tanacetum cinerariifolium]
ANGCWDLVVEVVGCSRDGERGGENKGKEDAGVGGKHCAKHSVSNREGQGRVYYFENFHF